VIFSEDEEDLWEETNEEGEEEEDESHVNSTVLAENMRLSLPSNLKRGAIGHDIFTSLRNQEAKIREDQINESLQKLRRALGEKAWMLRNNVRDASGGKGKLRAWSGVKQKAKEVWCASAKHHQTGTINDAIIDVSNRASKKFQIIYHLFCRSSPLCGSQQMLSG
jgi:hypothetical protein